MIWILLSFNVLSSNNMDCFFQTCVLLSNCLLLPFTFHGFWSPSERKNGFWTYFGCTASIGPARPSAETCHGNIRYFKGTSCWHDDSWVEPIFTEKPSRQVWVQIVSNSAQYWGKFPRPYTRKTPSGESGETKWGMLLSMTNRGTRWEEGWTASSHYYDYAEGSSAPNHQNWPSRLPSY